VKEVSDLHTRSTKAAGDRKKQRINQGEIRHFRKKSGKGEGCEKISGGNLSKEKRKKDANKKLA